MLTEVLVLLSPAWFTRTRKVLVLQVLERGDVTSFTVQTDIAMVMDDQAKTAVLWTQGLAISC